MCPLQYSETVDEFRARIKRRAIVMEIGGFRPPDDLMASWFGRVAYCAPGEEWPDQDGKPMHALAQINLRALPFRPQHLEDLAFITVFIGPDRLPVDAPNGENWLLRAYAPTDQLVPLAQVYSGSDIKPLPMRPRVVEEDYPCWEDVAFACPEELKEEYHDLFQNEPGFKLGGWPSLIQSEIYWAPWNKHPINPKYVFQINSTETGNWRWGQGGVGYFGRGTAPGCKDQWTLAWQCY